MEYKDNLIASEGHYLDKEILKKYPKAKGWLPFNAYDMVQCGYPLPDHGAMVRRTDGGVNDKNELLPSNGMWCKVSDVKKFLKQKGIKL